MNWDELLESIMTAKEELLKHKIEANTVILNGRKYGKLLNGKHKPSICGMAAEADNLPDEYDFVVQYVETPPVTNADRIRAMTDEELAKIIVCQNNRLGDDCFGGNCDECTLDWLKQEVDDAKNR